MSSPLSYAEQICYSSRETLYHTYAIALEMKYKDGVFVECGVAAGAQIIAMCAAARHKLIYAFDSFCGIPLPSNRDNQMPGIKLLTKYEQSILPDPGKQELETTGATSVSEESFWDHMANAFGEHEQRNILTVKGWFENTVPNFEEQEIALLRLDGDLYNSTWVCLQHLFPKVIKGGCVIIDDIELPGCKAACDEYFALIGYQPDYKFISNISYFYK